MLTIDVKNFKTTVINLSFRVFFIGTATGATPNPRLLRDAFFWQLHKHLINFDNRSGFISKIPMFISIIHSSHGKTQNLSAILKLQKLVHVLVSLFYMCWMVILCGHDIKKVRFGKFNFCGAVSEKNAKAGCVPILESPPSPCTQYPNKVKNIQIRPKTCFR